MSRECLDLSLELGVNHGQKGINLVHDFVLMSINLPIQIGKNVQRFASSYTNINKKVNGDLASAHLIGRRVAL